MIYENKKLLLLILSMIKNIDKKNNNNEMLLKNHNDFLKKIKKECSHIDNNLFTHLYLYITNSINDGFDNYYFYDNNFGFDILSVKREGNNKIYNNIKITKSKVDGTPVQTDSSKIIYDSDIETGKMQRNISLYMPGGIELIRFNSKEEKILKSKSDLLKKCSKLEINNVLFRNYNNLNIINELSLDQDMIVKKYLSNPENIENIEITEQIDDLIDEDSLNDKYDIRLNKSIIIQDTLKELNDMKDIKVDNIIDKENSNNINSKIYKKTNNLKLDEDVYKFLDYIIDKSAYNINSNELFK